MVLLVLGLLTGWVLLTPFLLVIYLRLGGPYQAWMAPAAGIAISVPMLGTFTAAGIALVALSVRGFIRAAGDDDDLAGGR